jgi:diaminopimelate decarboxylase
MSKELPFDAEQISELVERFPTPFHLYDEAGIRKTARQLNSVFDWVQPQDGVGYVNHFAVKATPNPHIHDILVDEGMGADASSGPEIELSRTVGLKYPYIMFTSNNTAPEEYREAYRAGAIINLDDINQIDVLVQALDGSIPDTLSFRYNPGGIKTGGDHSFIGEPGDAKFGVPGTQLEEAYKRAEDLGVKHFGMHTMVASNELNVAQHVVTATILFEKVAELSDKLGITFEFANLGGGLGIPYKPTEKPVDLGLLRTGIKQAYRQIILGSGLPSLRVVTENGRYVTGPNGFLVTRVRSIKDTFHHYVGLDASMADLMRPGIYDAYHEITVLGKDLGETAVQRVVGSLCENNDHFTGSETKDRELPLMDEGDVVVIHDTGAHGHAMGFNYNGKLRSGEVLLKSDGSSQLIRRPEKRNDLFATLDYLGLGEL